MVGKRQPGPPTLRDGLVRQRVLVTLRRDAGDDGDEGWLGICSQADATGLLLVSAAGQPLEFVAGDDQRHPTSDGAMFVPDERIRFVQILSVDASDI